jgi:hypothetical protein
MTKIETLLSTVGSSDFFDRVKVMSSGGMPEATASEIVAQQMIGETHAMTRALLLMFGKSTASEAMSDAEATLAQR